jgi:hypothetical protein
MTSHPDDVADSGLSVPFTLSPKGAAGGAWITLWLLDRYGPLTELPPRAAKTKREGGMA